MKMYYITATGNGVTDIHIMHADDDQYALDKIQSLYPSTTVVRCWESYEDIDAMLELNPLRTGLLSQ